MRRMIATREAVGSVLIAMAFLLVPAVATAQDTPVGEKDVILATTTSTQDSGLLDVLVPLFEEETGYELKPIAVGSGAALRLGEEGEADVLLVHSPQAEAEFMAAGFGSDRRMVMYNDFVIVGPRDDPAAIAGMASAVEAMRAIAAAEAPFVSRGDDSGTHRLELRLWEQVGIAPEGSWYQESGTGMGDTLNIASERDAYTVADRGTYLSLRERLALEILVEGDRALINIYHVIAVNPERFDTINAAGAAAFVAFLLDPATQQVIGGFGVEEFGQSLFTPCADNACSIEAMPIATPTG
jgi:tungstate transport system substrate-binding protein